MRIILLIIAIALILGIFSVRQPFDTSIPDSKQKEESEADRTARKIKHQFSCNCGDWSRVLENNPVGSTKKEIQSQYGIAKKKFNSGRFEVWVYAIENKHSKSSTTILLSFLGKNCLVYEDGNIFH